MTQVHAENTTVLLSDFTRQPPCHYSGVVWRGFTDRVMGGVSTAAFENDVIAGRSCVRMSGQVTRENSGGFVQMAMYFGPNEAELNAKEYAGVEFSVYGNEEEYNAHIRTADCGWYDDSYRATFFAPREWCNIRLSWTQFTPNRVKVPLNSARINRIALLGWMREFHADLALATVALYC